MLRIQSLAVWLAASGLMMGGCHPGSGNSTSASSAAAPEADPQSVSSRVNALAGAPVVVYLNLRGADLAFGGDDATTNTSQILGGSTYPPFDPADYTCGTLAACEEELVERANTMWLDWNIVFTAERPATGVYEMVMVGGPTIAGALGFAPLDCGNISPFNIAFAFSEAIADYDCGMYGLTAVITQELAHALGLCHNDTVGGLLYPQATVCFAMGSGFACGNQIDGCPCVNQGYDPFCPGPYFDSILGPYVDLEPPVVTFLEPADGEAVPPTFDVAVDATDERAVIEVFLRVDGVPFGASMFAEPYSWRLEDLPAGFITLEATAIDLGGNETTAVIQVEVGGQEDLCSLGEACTSSADCGNTVFCATSSLCAIPAADPGGSGVCSVPCTNDTECAGGYRCEATATVDACLRVRTDGVGCACAVPGTTRRGDESWGTLTGMLTLWLGALRASRHRARRRRRQ